MLEFGSKSEKIGSALYWITSFFSDQEPLKWELRTLASELISLSVSLKDSFLKEKDVILSETKSVVAKVTKLLSLAKNAGFVSPENYLILESELLKCAALLDYPMNISDLLSFESPREKTLGPAPTFVKDKIESRPTGKSSLKGFGAVSVKKNNRQSIIINLLKRKKEIMIKDVSPLIEGCSEKTIQRELTAMVRSGLVKKAGDKRWSRYSLA